MTWSKDWPKLHPDPQQIENINFNDPIDCNDPKHYTLKTNKEYNNKVPTHDPYSNPNADIYYECACGAILDPGTKSFATLNNAAMNKGWKVRWGETAYQPYCVECGKGVE